MIVAPPPAPRIEKHYALACGRLVHYRMCGTGPDVVLLHDSPRSSRLHLATMQALGDRFRVHALDTPGYGNSAPVDATRADMAVFADALGETLRVLGLERAPLYATHTSAKIALAYASGGGTTPLLLLDGLSIPERPASDDYVAAYLRPFEPDAAGAYLAREWSHVRDMLRWFPWFDRRAETRIAMDPPTETWLADYVVDLFAAGPNYSGAYAAALRYLALPDLLRCATPTIVAARADDVLYAFLDRVPVADNPKLAVERLPADRAAWLDWLGRRLGEACAGQTAAVRTKPQADDLPADYLAFADGQMRLFRAGPGAGPPLLILGAPTTLEALRWQRALGAMRETIVVELPGFGESDALPDPTLAAFVERLDALVTALGCGPVDVLGLGTASGLALAFAGSHPEAVRALALDGLPPVDADTAAAVAAHICPAFAFDAHAGSHLHQIWHMLRDSQAHWPWYDARPVAARTLPPAAEPTELHAALTDILKQPQHYGDAARAALATPMLAVAGRVACPTLLFTHATDPAYAGAAILAGHLPGSDRVERPDTIEAAAATLHAFLAAATPVGAFA